MGIGPVKRVLKGIEPRALAAYRSAVPHGTWEQMKSDPHHGGQQAYQDCRCDSIHDQKGLCAYCEIGIRDNDPLKCRVEHFHAKSDIASTHNWALDWWNMLAVCNGGSNPHVDQAGFHLEPMSKNLSCDAHKDRMIQAGRLSVQCEGWLLNPLQLAASPSLFCLEKNTGHLLPDSAACAASPPWPDNRHSSVEALVQHTIDMLNLNCDRLTQARLCIVRDIERNKKKQRQADYTAAQGLANLARFYFKPQWPCFFTTIRLCLSPAAETHLQGIAYQG